MPTYGYRCTVCKHEFERFQKISDPAVTNCEACGKPVKKIIYPVGIQFKGTGFYINDYAKSSPPSESAKSDAPSETKTSLETAAPATTGTDSKTDTKPAATPTPAAPTPSTNTSSSS